MLQQFLSNKPFLVVVCLLIIVSVFLFIGYRTNNALTQSIRQFNEQASQARSNQDLRKAVDTFFTQNQPIVSVLKSGASEFGGNPNTNDIVIRSADPSSGPKGTAITLWGLNLDLPAYIVFGPGIIQEQLISQAPGTLTFPLPDRVLVPSCPPFPGTVCDKLGNKNKAGSTISTNTGSYTVYVVNQEGKMSNPFSVQITK